MAHPCHPHWLHISMLKFFALTPCGSCLSAMHVAKGFQRQRHADPPPFAHRFSACWMSRAYYRGMLLLNRGPSTFAVPSLLYPSDFMCTGMDTLVGFRRFLLEHLGPLDKGRQTGSASTTLASDVVGVV